MIGVHVDSTLKKAFGVRGLKTLVRVPTANPFCERLIGSIRRDCMDHMIPINERHVKAVMKEVVSHLQSWAAAYVFGSWDSGTTSG